MHNKSFILTLLNGRSFEHPAISIDEYTYLLFLVLVQLLDQSIILFGSLYNNTNKADLTYFIQEIQIILRPILFVVVNILSGNRISGYSSSVHQ